MKTKSDRGPLMLFSLMAKHIGRETFDKIFNDAIALNAINGKIDARYLSDEAREAAWQFGLELRSQEYVFDGVPFIRDTAEYLN